MGADESRHGDTRGARSVALGWAWQLQVAAPECRSERLVRDRTV